MMHVCGAHVSNEKWNPGTQAVEHGFCGFDDFSAGIFYSQY